MTSLQLGCLMGMKTNKLSNPFELSKHLGITTASVLLFMKLSIFSKIDSINWLRLSLACDVFPFWDLDKAHYKEKQPPSLPNRIE